MKKLLAALIVFGFVISSHGQTTYIWTGAVNSNFSTAGNWSPVRQTGRSTDILVFQSGTSLSVINVNQVTIGQILVINHTQLRLTPSSGNPKVISIEGDGDYHDFMNPEGNRDAADIKYMEYMNSGNNGGQNDLASIKYEEYEYSENNERPIDLASQKYTEYREPQRMGMGDKKLAELSDNPYSDNDMTIENGCSMTIDGTDPNLSIYLKHNATAAIFGSLIFTGGINHTINSFDTYAIAFKAGSVLIQSCPGNIFSNTGINNSAVFESGSSFLVNHINASDPFGLDEPSSKVKFEKGSSIIFNTCNSNTLRLNGRSYSNLTINSNCSINVQEGITSDVNIDNIFINSGGTLIINNLSGIAQPNLNIRGDITVNGILRFQQNESNRINLNLTGESVQSISGSGVIDLNTGIKTLFLNSDIKLNRDIDAMCPVIHRYGQINTNGFTFSIFSFFTSPEALPVGVLIVAPKSSGAEKHDSTDQSNAGEKAKDKTIKVINTISGNQNDIPADYSVSQNYPNPFNPKTRISFDTPFEGNVSIRVYDIDGSEIVSLTDGIISAGSHEVSFDGTNCASGIYFYKIIASSGSNRAFTRTIKMVLAK